MSRAIKILSFQNFYEVLKTCSAGRKDFFDTLKPGSRQASRLFVEMETDPEAKNGFPRSGGGGDPAKFPGKNFERNLLGNVAMSRKAVYNVAMYNIMSTRS